MGSDFCACEGILGKENESNMLSTLNNDIKEIGENKFDENTLNKTEKETFKEEKDNIKEYNEMNKEVKKGIFNLDSNHNNSYTNKEENKLNHNDSFLIKDIYEDKENKFQEIMKNNYFYEEEKNNNNIIDDIEKNINLIEKENNMIINNKSFKYKKGDEEEKNHSMNKYNINEDDNNYNSFNKDDGIFNYISNHINENNKFDQKLDDVDNLNDSVSYKNDALNNNGISNKLQISNLEEDDNNKITTDFLINDLGMKKDNEEEIEVDENEGIIMNNNFNNVSKDYKNYDNNYSDEENNINNENGHFSLCDEE